MSGYRSTCVWHSGIAKSARSRFRNRSGTGSSFLEYCTSACIFSSRESPRKYWSVRTTDGGTRAEDVSSAILQYEHPIMRVPMRVTIIAAGARGDVQPYVALGLGLR